jgi:alternate signal-mediated exported protein
MNNRKRAIVALAAGTLLLGTTSGQTFATWQTSRNLQGSPIYTGEFALAPTSGNVATGWTWTITGRSTNPTPTSTTNVLDTYIQPGDTIVAKTYVNASLAGTNLVATLTPSNLTGLNVTNRTTGVADSGVNPPALTWTTSVKVGNPVAASVTMGATQNNVPVTVTIQVPRPCNPGETTGQCITRLPAGTTDVYQNIKFGDFTLTLTQVRSN